MCCIIDYFDAKCQLQAVFVVDAAVYGGVLFSLSLQPLATHTTMLVELFNMPLLFLIHAVYVK